LRFAIKAERQAAEALRALGEPRRLQILRVLRDDPRAVGETYLIGIEISAPPDRVFDHLTQPDLLVRWMGDYARLEAVAGGEFSVDIDGVLIRGRFVRDAGGRNQAPADPGENGMARMPGNVWAPIRR